MGIGDSPPLGNLWLVVSGSTRSKLVLMGPLSDIKLILLQKCFIQEYEIDYKETFTPIACISSIRTLLAVKTASKWNLFRWMSKMPSLMGI